LPLAYQKDMQEDKQGAMEAFGALSLAVRAMTGMVADIVPDEARMKAAAGEGYATATDLADWLVRTLKMPFRDAHHVTGRIVGLASKQGVALHELPLKTMQEVEPKITAEACACCRWKASVKSRTSYGGTAPKNVTAQAKAWLKRLEKERNWAECKNFAVNFMIIRLSPEPANLCMVRPAYWGFRRDQ
jgi:Argininosuccinate lyase